MKCLIEQIFAFAPLHDAGKIRAPEKILMKSGQLDADEAQIIRMHAAWGREIIDDVVTYFDLSDLDGIDILRNIVEFHHEAVDGSGYL